MFQRQEKKMHKNINRQGYTLIEVLIAMAVFAIGILAVFSMQITATSSNALARGLTENYTAAMDKVEELLILPYGDPDLAVGVHNAAKDSDGIDNDGNGVVDDASDNNGYLNLRWQVWENRVWDQDIKSVNVQITSRVNGRRDKTINIDFLKADM